MNYNFIFIHKGNQDYFKTALKQAKKTNPESKIIVIGDSYDKKIKGVDFYDINSFNLSFSKIYKHYSKNQYNFELFCFQRWFILKEFMINSKLDFVFACDSDLMIFEDLSKYINIYKKYLAGICMCEYQENYRWSASGHISFWTLEGIIKFCDFLIEYYTTDKIK